MSWTAVASAWAGVVRTTAETVEQTAATVSAAMRAEDLLGNGIPPGTCVGAGTKWDCDGRGWDSGRTRVGQSRPAGRMMTRVEAATGDYP
ncbi:hypothetical protein GCM10010515_48090 [Streptomyces fructofermentans]|uniref:Uncharacterized protein n=1 Tax=Streptomyces fructofermentans TaxID=152141 RepID=A0A918KT11_9ACTN|nr:hypothetical protein GCM10010515_48090 [Streptomyces fructofermentans]